MGDFNQIISSHEKFGGRPEPSCRMEQFREVLTRRGLIDMEARGCKFTWTNNHPIHSLIKKRLDRALCNVAWRNLFDDACVQNLPRAHSDHCPILISLPLVEIGLSPSTFRVIVTCMGSSI